MTRNDGELIDDELDDDELDEEELDEQDELDGDDLDDSDESDDVDDIDEAELGAPVGESQSESGEPIEPATAEEPAGEVVSEAATTSPPSTPQATAQASEAKADAEAAFNVRIAKLEHNLSDAVLHERRLAAQLKWAKTRVKEISEELDGARARGPERHPLFDGGEPAEEEPAEEGGDGDGEPSIVSDDAGGSSEAVESTADQPSNESWRDVPVSVLELPGSLNTRLEEHGIWTLGHLEDLRGGDGLLTVEGIGRAKADKIEDAVLTWLSKNRDSAVLAAAK